MPLKIVSRNLQFVYCDAVVNSVANFGQLNESISNSLGFFNRKRILKKSQNLGSGNTGDVKVIEVRNLPYRYMIHQIKPYWNKYVDVRDNQLRQCYKNIFKTLSDLNCNSIAIPLLLEHERIFSKYEITKIAIEEIKSFLLNNDKDIDVYLVVEDKNNFQISKSTQYGLNGYINYHLYNDESYNDEDFWDHFNEDIEEIDNYKDIADLLVSSYAGPEHFRRHQSLLDLIEKLDDCFAISLMKLIDAREMKDVEVYKKANIARQTWYKIMNDKNYKPSKNTVLAFAFALELKRDETEALLKTAGFALSDSIKFDVVISYCLIEGIHDIYKVNEILFDFDLPLLGG